MGKVQLFEYTLGGSRLLEADSIFCIRLRLALILSASSKLFFSKNLSESAFPLEILKLKTLSEDKLN